MTQNRVTAAPAAALCFLWNSAVVMKTRRRVGNMAVWTRFNLKSPWKTCPSQARRTRHYFDIFRKYFRNYNYLPIQSNLYWKRRYSQRELDDVPVKELKQEQITKHCDHIYANVCDSCRDGPHLSSLLSHLPVILLELVVECLTARHQVLSANLTGSLLPHRLVALDMVLLLLLPVDD